MQVQVPGWKINYWQHNCTPYWSTPLLEYFVLSTVVPVILEKDSALAIIIHAGRYYSKYKYYSLLKGTGRPYYQSSNPVLVLCTTSSENNCTGAQSRSTRSTINVPELKGEFYILQYTSSTIVYLQDADCNLLLRYYSITVEYSSVILQALVLHRASEYRVGTAEIVRRVLGVSEQYVHVVQDLYSVQVLVMYRHYEL